MVSFSNFGTLDPETADLARELIGTSDRQGSPFLPFMNAWMGFNGWMESVTDAGTDSAMITALADNRRMADAYDELVANNAKFRDHVLAFANLWPVLKVKDVRKKLGRDAFWRYDRDELLQVCLREGVHLQPPGWNRGDDPTWPSVLRTIYLIRCNLFHGAKSPQHGRDRDLTHHANRVLREIVAGTGCFDWHD